MVNDLLQPLVNTFSNNIFIIRSSLICSTLAIYSLQIYVYMPETCTFKIWYLNQLWRWVYGYQAERVQAEIWKKKNR